MNLRRYLIYLKSKRFQWILGYEIISSALRWNIWNDLNCLLLSCSEELWVECFNSFTYFVIFLFVAVKNEFKYDRVAYSRRHWTLNEYVWTQGMLYNPHCSLTRILYIIPNSIWVVLSIHSKLLPYLHSLLTEWLILWILMFYFSFQAMFLYIFFSCVSLRTGLKSHIITTPAPLCCLWIYHNSSIT